MPGSTVRVTSTHHVAVKFDCPLDTIWNDIVQGLGMGRRFAEQGYRVTPLDDVRAYLGGYRMMRESNEFPDERLTFLSERDDATRRLSLCAYYLGPHARGTVVNATYSAAEDGEGNWYKIDCHGTYDLEVDAGASAADVAVMMAASKEEMDVYLRSSLESQRPILETQRLPDRQR